jgi:hypothetical protein
VTLADFTTAEVDAAVSALCDRFDLTPAAAHEVVLAMDVQPIWPLPARHQPLTESTTMPKMPPAPKAPKAPMAPPFMKGGKPPAKPPVKAGGGKGGKKGC